MDFNRVLYNATINIEWVKISLRFYNKVRGTVISI